METRPSDNLSGYLEEVVARVHGACDEANAREILLLAAAEIRECVNAEKVAAASRLAAWLAHKVNNPLGTISGNVQLLGRRLERDISDAEALQTYRRYIDAVQTQVERCAGTTSELLEFTRSRDVEAHPVDLAQAVAHAVELASYSRGAGNVTVELPSGLLEVQTDRQLLVRVLYEVITNAVYAAGDTETVRVSARLGPSEPDGSEWVLIEVVDSGPGIPEDVLPRIFEPFFSTREKARGLGLTTSLAIMRQLGGAIEVSQTGPAGTVVTIAVPVRRS